MRLLERLCERRPRLRSALRGSASRPSSALSATSPDHQSNSVLGQPRGDECAPAHDPLSNCEGPGASGRGLFGSREDPPISLWDLAYDALRKSDKQLVEQYEELLSRELQTIGMYPPRAVFSIGGSPLSSHSC